MGREGGPSEKDMGLKPEETQILSDAKPVKGEGGKQYSPGEIADLKASRAKSDAAIQRDTQRSNKDWKGATFAEEAEFRAKTEMEDDFRKRDEDKERYKLENKTAVLSAINRLWGDIDKALNYRPEQPDASIIDKNWAADMLKILTELEGQVKFEGSFPTRIFNDINRAGQSKDTGSKPWIETKWKDKVKALIGSILEGTGSGESYHESIEEERQRRAARDKAESAYKDRRD
ncbi:hypothetical protein A3B21_05200 [Candidatus Uhrbacteria bacterium RIFCSPLOWO2_01_FULL_47_24]|uniref:Uncharacterized protein n=1 Tax=Candidatus Uhrbacteria bacterium RIFCSPLOWO2_01_FULL_47_24 TaxID=1802401 RepID=A0A1F7UUW3_9BACT|nr:MAG: hypothetical protein A2753_03235 [Candidatus Uhrbacteria bacterium RIFCSPHIGHO2_01_FULL_47_11]OGL69344.1 MAG: hypothetical protein A3D58_03585 [Candidatus Uhrbacteria bacterium RIFCSPHIGHO2_02_FULL_46_47]OGL75863.1 MAG: hypothetical protein A3F52_03460 [Candidatus Uhrbacteria bacterium RIFCSPHIGHO2_12_FULL_47_11]OGL82080.1 MAG: hypothetical protein A3B21_05200 [Candidatus Uhrbacteria bacterium RIFCSPLOWO2_01_FULL_47_24]OGL85475.1 MAG: hypothetical protein A3J03_05370 [Candidatus Uhrbact